MSHKLARSMFLFAFWCLCTFFCVASDGKSQNEIFEKNRPPCDRCTSNEDCKKSFKCLCTEGYDCYCVPGDAPEISNLCFYCPKAWGCERLGQCASCTHPKACAQGLICACTDQKNCECIPDKAKLGENICNFCKGNASCPVEP